MLFRLSLFLATIAVVRAQTPAPAAHTHLPPDPKGPLVLDQFVISASPFSRNQIDLAQSTSVLSGRSLLLKKQPSLGETLAGEVGMQSTAFGPGASRPIIRGLGGDRVRLLENSVGILDASVASPDHAVSVEPFLVERIEIVRGPAALLYGSNAVGGVVNTITHRVETDLPTEPIRGAAEVRGGGAGEEWAGGGMLDLAWRGASDRAVVLHLDGFSRDTENIRIPGFADSAERRADELAHAREHGEPDPEFAFGRLPNSFVDTDSGAVGLSYVTSAFHIGLSHSGMNSRYGVPGATHAHEAEAASGAGDAPGVSIALRQRRTDAQAEWHGERGLLTGVRFKLGHARYRHLELEPDGAVGTTYRSKGYDGRLELLHRLGEQGQGAVGLQSQRTDFGAEGEEAFLPPSRTTQNALFAFEETERGRTTWQWGGRIEHAEIVADASSLEEGDLPVALLERASPAGRSRREWLLSGSVGLVHRFDPVHTATFSVAHTTRAPNAQELYAFGPHLGTQAFEVGNADLDPERSLGLEASLRRKSPLVSAAATVYLNDFRGYIFEAARRSAIPPASAGSPVVAVEAEDGGWQFVPADDVDAEDGLPVYDYVQRDARFWGVELESVWHVLRGSETPAQSGSRGTRLPRGLGTLDLRLAADLTRAEQRGGEALPRIPAARLLGGLEWAHGPWSAGVDVQHALSQRRTAPGEAPSGRYTLVNAGVARTIIVSGGEIELFARVTNLTDTEARPHTSFLRHQAPLPGRAVVAGARWRF